MLLSILFLMKTSSVTLLVDNHWALDQVVVYCKWSHFLIVKDTQDGHVVGETITSNLDELVGSIIWSTLRERAIECIVVIFELAICEVNTVESKINENFVATGET